jgi:hypothetical protein
MVLHVVANVTRHTSHVTRHTSHVTHHTSLIIRHTSHVTRHTSHARSNLFFSLTLTGAPKRQAPLFEQRGFMICCLPFFETWSALPATRLLRWPRQFICVSSSLSEYIVKGPDWRLSITVTKSQPRNARGGICTRFMLLLPGLAQPSAHAMHPTLVKFLDPWLKST